MKNIIEKMEKLEAFTEKLFCYSGWQQDYNKCMNIDNRNYRPDYIFEYENKKYAIEVRNSLNFDTYKMKFHLDRLQQLKQGGFNNILIVYNRVRDDKVERFKDSAIILDISNILYIIKDSNILTNELMSILDYSIENIELKEPEINIEIKENLQVQEEDRIALLESIGTGINCFKTYQEFCVSTLKYLFLDKLDLWEEQSRTDDGLNVFDLICKIKNKIDDKDDFFISLQKYFKSKYIIFEFKNYDEPISQYEICTTEKYLYETALRKVAIVITRRGINGNGDKMTKCILRESGKLILVLDDKDLKNMIKMKQEGENPEPILTNKLDFLLTHLEK